MTSTASPVSTPMPRDASRYVAPDWFTRKALNPMVARLTTWGVSVWGSRLLEVPGRSTGVVRTTPVNVLEVASERFLVAPRGVTQWVRNVRVAGRAGLRLGRHVEQIELVEVDDADKPAVLRTYLRRWWWEVGKFFDGIDRDSSDGELLDAAAGFPVFRIVA